MTLSNEVLLAGLVGFVVGIALTVLLNEVTMKRAIRNAKGLAKQQEEEKERNDPANWWKYGDDPFGKSIYEKDDKDD